MEDALQWKTEAAALPTSVILETDRLLVRELLMSDAAFVLRLTNDPSFIENVADKGIRSLDDARRFLRDGAWTNQERAGYGQFLVERKSDGAAVGICGLLYREPHGITDVGFAILPDYRGNGYAFEAAETLVAYGRTELGLESIAGITAADNAASIRVLEKLGMTFQRTVRLSEDGADAALYYKMPCASS